MRNNDDKTLILSRIEDSLTIIKHIFDKYYPFYGVETVFQFRLSNIRGKEIFLCFTRQNGSKEYKIFVDQAADQDNFAFFTDLIKSTGLDFIKEGYKAYDYHSEKKAEEEYNEKMNLIYLATLINGGVNDCIEREGRKVLSDIKERSYKYYHVYCKYIKGQSEALAYLSQLLQDIVEKKEFSTSLDLELHFTSTNPVISFTNRNYQSKIYLSRYSFLGDNNKQLLIKKYARGIFESEDIDVCLSDLKNKTEHEKKAIKEREGSIKAKQEESKQEKLKMIQDAEKHEKKMFLLMIACMVILIVLSFVADYYIFMVALGFNSIWAYIPAVMLSVVGCVHIKEMFGYY